MGYPSLAFTQSHIWVGKEQGLFRKYGVEVDPVFLRGGQVATQALAAGEPPMVNVGTVIQANLTGYNLVSGRSAWRTSSISWCSSGPASPAWSS